MDENYFVENDKFLSMNGILGRRNFVINTLIIVMIIQTHYSSYRQ